MQISPLVAIVAPEMYGRPQVVTVKPGDGDLRMTLATDMQDIDTPHAFEE